MAKQNSKTKPTKALAAGGKGLIPERYQDIAACGAILLAVIIFFSDALFSGLNFLSEGDNVAFYSFIPYLNAAKDTGEFPLWVPYIFGGMPSLASFLAAGDRSWDILSMLLFAIPKGIGQAMNNDTARLAMWYAIYGWGVYTLMRSKDHERLVAVFSSISAIFSTFVIVWIMIGHSTKPVSLATLPWIFLALERTRERFSLLNLFLLTLAMIALVSATHPQMMFYFGCAAGLYLIVELVIRLIAKQGAVDVLKAAGALVIATVLALGTHADMFLATREYTPHSTRGSAPLVQVEGQQQLQSGGNDYEYATNWSFSPGEMMTFLVPNYYGFGNTSVKLPNGGTEQRTNLYWGQMPFTDAANYMGIGVLLLALLGAWFNRRDPFVIFLVVLSVFSVLLSFGKNLPILYDVFYNFIPSFNKFRAPSMALVLVQFAAPVLAGYGITTVLKWRGTSEGKRPALVALIAAGTFLAIGFAYSAVNEKGYKDAVAEAIVTKNPGEVKSAAEVSPQFLDLVYDEMQSDWTTTGFIAVIFGGVIFLMVGGKLSPSLGLIILVLLTIGDLWRVDKRPYDPKEGSPEQKVFATTDAVQFLKQDPGVFRVADLSRMPANYWAYHFVENVHGYSSAKIRLYQDMLDVAGPGPGREPVPGNSRIINGFVWDLLNVKYVITDQPLYQNIEPDFRSNTGLLIYKNNTYRPRAWFVDQVLVESDRRKMLEQIRDGRFEASKVAYVEKTLASKIGPADSNATVKVVGKGNQHMKIETSSATPSFLVVSEIYYPEWHATIDGSPVNIERTNFFMRGLLVPAGKHTIEFTFTSPAFETGRTISMASNGIAILIGLAGIGLWYRNRQQQRGSAEDHSSV